MKKNLIISAVGDGSRHIDWCGENANFDIILIYYGNNTSIADKYQNECTLLIQTPGQKYPLIKRVIEEHKELILSYDYIWLPDDDVTISSEDINKCFALTEEYGLLISQPSVLAVDGYVVYDITRPIKDCILHYTNFVEVMAPLFSRDTLLNLMDDFDESQSGWGLDITWSPRLGDPIDKIAVIDAVMMAHTKPQGSDYSRFKTHPEIELQRLAAKYQIENRPSKKIYKKIVK